MTRHDVAAALREAGRDDDSPNDISAALAYLARTQRALKLGDGLWTRWTQPTVEGRTVISEQRVWEAVAGDEVKARPDVVVRKRQEGE